MFHWWMPGNAAAHGYALDRHMALNLGIIAALFALSQIVLLAGLLRGNTQARRISVWNALAFIALAAIFLGLGILGEHLWAQQHFEGPSYDALQVEVTGRQFQWYFRYPGTDAQFGRTNATLIDPAAGNPLGIERLDAASADDIVSSEFVLPVGREVNLRVRSQDVIHGFFIPAMRVKQNAVPGSIFTIHFTPTQIGEYGIVCSQVCGSGHYRMDARLRVVSLADFSAWMQSHAPRVRQ